MPRGYPINHPGPQVWHLGNIDGCREEHERGLGFARRSGSPEAEARALGGLADAAYAQGKMRSAFDHFSRCVALSQQHGFGRIEVANRSMVGFSRIYLNEVPQAKEDGDAAARAATLVGQPRAELLGETMGVFACYEHGDFDLMQGYLGRTMRLARQLGARRFEAQGLEMQARVLLDTGRRAEAAEMLQEALAICREAGTQFCGPKVTSALSRAVDDPAERAALLAEGKEMLRRGAVGHNHLWFYRDAIEALLSAARRSGVPWNTWPHSRTIRGPSHCPGRIYSPPVVAFSPAILMTAGERTSFAFEPHFITRD